MRISPRRRKEDGRSMGTEDKNAEMVVYCDGQPIRAASELPGITTEKAAAAAAALSSVWAAISITIKEAATALAATWDAIMAAERFNWALRWAEAYNRPLAYRYRHTKRERIRKKYRKRILSWYRAEVIGGGD